MWSDNESSVDLLRFNYLTSVIQQIVLDPKLLPTTIGLFGDWGSGKSTLIKLLEKELHGKPKTLCLSFNGWLFEGYEDAKTALMGTILDGLKHHIEKDATLMEKTGKKLKKLTKKLDWLQLLLSAGKHGLPLLAGMPHITAATVAIDAIGGIKKLVANIPEGVKNLEIDDVKKFIKDDEAVDSEEIRKAIKEFRIEFEELINDSGLDRIVVFIDDLDRCLPNTIIETLEAIRLFLFVPKTAFIIGADERLVEYAVRKRFPELPGSNVEVGRDYLEKMVQIPVRVPPLSFSDTESYMNLLCAERRLDQANYSLICDHVAKFKPTEFNQKSFDLNCAKDILKTVSTELQGDLDLIAKIAPILTGGLGGSPRRVKRFLNTLLMRVEMGKFRGLDLQVSLMAKIMLLEYIKPEFFKDLARLQETQNGKPSEFNILEKIDEPEVEEVKAVKGTSTDKAKAKDEKVAPVPSIVLPGEVDIWLSDEWMKSWIKLSPNLADVDLRPYFYIAHDKIGSLGQSHMRLSPRAQEVLSLLVSPGKTSRAKGIKDGASLLKADAISIFEELAQRIKQAETLSKNENMHTLFSFVGTQRDLIPQLLSVFRSIPETRLVSEIIPSLSLLINGEHQYRVAFLSLLKEWSALEKKGFAQIAQQAISDIESGKK